MGQTRSNVICGCNVQPVIVCNLRNVFFFSLPKHSDLGSFRYSRSSTVWKIGWIGGSMPSSGLVPLSRILDHRLHRWLLYWRICVSERALIPRPLCGGLFLAVLLTLLRQHNCLFDRQSISLQLVPWQQKMEIRGRTSGSIPFVHVKLYNLFKFDAEAQLSF